jgi:hypothetical protein
MEPLGGTPEVQFGGHRHKRLELAYLHEIRRYGLVWARRPGCD